MQRLAKRATSPTATGWLVYVRVYPAPARGPAQPSSYAHRTCERCSDLLSLNSYSTTCGISLRGELTTAIAGPPVAAVRVAALMMVPSVTNRYDTVRSCKFNKLMQPSVPRRRPKQPTVCTPKHQSSRPVPHP